MNTAFDNARTVMFNRIIDNLNGIPAMICDLDLALPPTLCANAMHMASPIVDIPTSELEEVDRGYGKQIAILGIEEVLGQCKFPSEQNISWARRAESFNCENLKEFTGPKEAIHFSNSPS